MAQRKTWRIRAIETQFDGHRFRSRIEARHAVFLKTLGIPYEYEKEGYQIGRLRYLPDFWLPQQQCWLEVKPTSPTYNEEEKAAGLAAGTGHPVFIAFGPIAQPQGDWRDAANASCIAYFPDVREADYPEQDAALPHGCFDFAYGIGWSFANWWTECPVCHTFGLAFGGYASYLACGHSVEDTQSQIFDSDRLLEAYAAARSARFEFGESGAPR